MSDPIRRHRRLALGLVVLALVGFVLPPTMEWLAAGRLRALARARGTSVFWSTLEYEPPLTLLVRDLVVVRSLGDTACRVESLAVRASLTSVLLMQPRPAALSIAHAWLRIRASTAENDTLAPDEESAGAAQRARTDRAPHVRAEAGRLVRVLLLPARRLPRLELRDVAVVTGDDGERRARFSWLALEPSHAGVRLNAAGTLEGDPDLPFRLDVEYDASDRLSGGVRFMVPGGRGGSAERFTIAIDGRLHQDRRHGVLTLGDSTRVQLGRVSVRLAGRIEQGGPRFALRLEADDVSATECQASTPAPLLGPLADLAIQGSFDYHASFDLDFAQPDSVRLEADVIPHGLALVRGGGGLPLAALAAPFTASIHLPHERVMTRELSASNVHDLELADIDSTLVHAVLTNEDGAFFRHRGFNLEAVRRSIADDIHAAAWRRGAGTITMQLVRNLYLGHARTLPRKAQEVVLAWLLENLTGIGKERMLEIYLNIVEWGPDACGADEAARFYFDHDARRLTVPEALFMATVLPAPAKWRSRLAADGSLRPFEQAQMHFIGRAMAAKGWLAPENLPASDSLRIDWRGAARLVLLGSGSVAKLDSLNAAEHPDSLRIEGGSEP